MNSILSTKYESIASRFTAEQLSGAYPVSKLADFFNGTDARDWREWQAKGLLPMLPGTTKIALCDAIEFWVSCGIKKPVPVAKRVKVSEKEVDDFMQRAVSAANK